jgi:hypothetical protein
MNNNTIPKKKQDVTESKPAQLAKIVYDGIIRMIKAKKARDAEKKPIFELDSERKRRVNVHSKN